MTDVDRLQVTQQCTLLTERYQSCMPRNYRGVHWRELDTAACDHGTSMATISVPYADSVVSFVAQFDVDSSLPDLHWTDTDQPPDFFPAVDFHRLMASLDGSRDEALLRVVRAFMASVVEFNESLIPQRSYLWRALRTLKQHELLRSGGGQYEILVERQRPGEETVASVVIAVRLPLLCANTPAFLTAENVAEELECCLVFRFAPTNDQAPLTPEAVHRAVPRLFLSTSLKNFLQQTGHELRLPHLSATSFTVPPDNEDTPECRRLLDYALFVHDSVQQMVQQAGDSCAVRRRVMAALVRRLHGAVLEYDAELYRSAAFLLEWKDFFFVLRVRLQKFFPHQRQGPELRLRSIYHTVRAGAAEDGAGDRENEQAGREPFEQAFLQDVPHSPRWEPEEFVERWLKYVREVLPKFQRDSVRNNNI